jgi:Winged helix DNA-binding domain
VIQPFVCPLSPALLQACTDPALTPGDVCLLVKLHEYTDWFGARTVKRSVLARALRRQRTHVTSALRRLIRAGYVIEDSTADAQDRRQKGLRLAMAAPPMPAVQRTMVVVKTSQKEAA